jgi:hypothetical protein
VFSFSGYDSKPVILRNNINIIIYIILVLHVVLACILDFSAVCISISIRKLITVRVTVKAIVIVIRYQTASVSKKGSLGLT